MKWIFGLAIAVTLLACNTQKKKAETTATNQLSNMTEKYEKVEEETFWIKSTKTTSNGIWGQDVECYQIQRNSNLDQNGEWELLCEAIEYLDFKGGTFLKATVKKKWLQNHENLMDRTPYDLELVTVSERVKDKNFTNPITTKISTDKTTYNVGEEVILSMEVVNNGAKDFRFLPWGTPLENMFTGDCLDVKANGNAINYTGIMVRRMPATDADYITLSPEKSATGEAKLNKGYNVNQAGTYTIQFKESYIGLPASNVITIEVK